MKVRKDDTVIVVAGAAKGKKGKVLRVFPATNRIIVEGTNMKKKHEKKHSRGGQGQMVEVARSMHVSNVMLLDPKGGKQTRAGAQLLKDKKIRIARKSGQEIK